eukprot:15364456-Ditylum_brightwellii.AAC.1
MCYHPSVRKALSWRQLYGGGEDRHIFGGWIADSYVVYCHLLPVLCGKVNDILPHDVPGLSEYNLLIQAA